MRHAKRSAFVCAETADRNCTCGFSRRQVMTAIAAFAATAVTTPGTQAQTPAPARIVDIVDEE